MLKCKIISLALSALLLLSVTACNPGSTTAGEAPVESSAASDVDAKQYYDEEGKLILPLTDTPVNYSVIYRKNNLDIGTQADKYPNMLELAEKELGLTFTIEEVENNGWTEKINVVFASGAVPNLVWGSIDNLVSFVDQVMDLTDLVENNTVYLKNYLAENPQYYQGEAIGGRLYSLSHTRATANRAHNYTSAINMTWLEKLGLAVPETLDEFTEVLRAFVTQDPNGNGEQDEIGFSFISGYGISTQNLDFIRTHFGLVNDGYNSNMDDIMVEDGTVFYVPMDQRYYDMLVWLNMCYAEGLMDKDGFTQTAADLMQKGQADRLGYVFGEAFIYSTTGTDLQDDFDYILPMKDKGGKMVARMDVTPADFMRHVFTLSKDCPNPEYLVMMAEYFNSDEARMVTAWCGPQVEYDEIQWDANNRTNAGWWYMEKDGKLMIETNRSSYPTDQGYNNYSQFRISNVMNDPPLYLTLDFDQKRILDESRIRQDARNEFFDKAFYNEMFPLGEMSAEDSTRRAEMSVEIKNYTESFFADSIINGIDESKWQQHLNNLQSLNIDEYIRDYQALYDFLIAAA